MSARLRPEELPLQQSNSQSQLLPAEGGVWLMQQQADPSDFEEYDEPVKHYDQQDRQQPQHLPQLQQLQIGPDDTPSDEPQTFLFYNPNSSVSDLTSPLTPTFSQTGGHNLYYTSSASSLDLLTAASSTCSESPVSPVQPSHNTTVTSTPKRQLPDVQEDPLEREDEAQQQPTMTMLTEDQLSRLYDCLCDSPCIHQNSDMIHSADWTHGDDNDAASFDYDMGFMSDGEFDGTLRVAKKRTGAESPLSSLTNRFGSRFPTLNRWRSTKRRNRAFTATSEPSLDFPPALSRAPSTSRSSSLSAPSRRYLDRTNEPPLPTTPVLSFYESTDSVISLPQALDIEKANVRQSLERDRAMATTPLLPPLLTQPPSVLSQNHSRPQSPLQSPTVAPLSNSELNSPTAYATPPLSTKPSFSSFRPPLLSSFSSPTLATSEVIVTIPHLLEQHDEWSDRLGHANYTIIPRPYVPSAADLETLRTFRADWDLARINYTKHIVRTGEHYGTTSKMYAFTEAKWAATEREWKAAHEGLLERVVGDGVEQLSWNRLQDDTPAAVPRMLDAKFPDLGDEDIVGPMMRDAVMVRDPGTTLDSRNGSGSGAKFWRNLAGKVGLRK